MIRAAALAGTAMMGLQGGTLHAQATQPQASGDNDVGIQDIIVTAERRATNLQNTPLSIIAVTQETLEAKGIQDLQDLSHFTPNLSISPTRGGGSSAASFVIRGISGGGGATGERGVGLYVDGIYMPRTSGAVLRVLDVDRIEVLRGPQGTLFGRNSTGGAIRIFSKQPTDRFEGSLEGVVGTFKHSDVIGMVNIPIGNGFALRAQGAYLYQDGFVSRGTQKLGMQEDYVARVQLRGELAPGLTATWGFLYNKSKENATPWVMQEFDMRPGIDGIIQGNYGDWLNDSFKAAGQAPLAAYNDPRLVKGPYQAPDVCLMDDFNPDYDAACDQYNNDEYWQADLNVNWSLSDTVSLHSITGYSKLKHRAVTDWELIGMEMRYDILNSRVFYQELQLNAALFGGAVDLVAGGTYFHEKSGAPYNYIVNRRGTSNYPATPGTPANADGGLYTRTISDVFQTSDSVGLFASGTWHVTDKLNLTAGLRHAWDHKDYTQTRYPPPATPYQTPDFTVAPGTSSTTVNASAPFRALDYRATIDYHFTDDIMAYATISKAYKAGSFSYTVLGWTATNNATGANQSPLVKPVPNEEVVNYEFGFRTTLFNRRLRLNPTAFLMHYTDRQAVIRVNCGTGPLAQIVPGSAACPVGFIPTLQDQGDAWIRGIEVDGQLVVAPGLTVDGSLGLTAYTLKNPPAGTTHLYPDIPTPTYNIGATYTTRMGAGKATLNVNYAYVGKQSVYPDDTADSGYILPSYGLVNARVQIQPTALPITLTIYANNLLDKVYATYAQRFGGGFWDSGAGTGIAAPPRNALSVVRGRPSDIGVSLKFNF
ncbi:TonB-dependent receptor [Sphingobium nicotianae]|uniref:TonB-dependent receptor n=1 Tax=Sphingobium nicotianae TaxID=2782607 RepID=A0A9X1DA41_9SPHN|nr:TonB-dependent receptor [Sphingobium nicotianae]MBT2186140.1 TonB-dependent receptor [Sphingobium nicotianae]